MGIKAKSVIPKHTGVKSGFIVGRRIDTPRLRRQCRAIEKKKSRGKTRRALGARCGSVHRGFLSLGLKDIFQRFQAAQAFESIIEILSRLLERTR